MTLTPDSISSRSPYRRGAYDGLWLGLLLAAVFFCMVGSVKAGGLSLLAFAGCVAVPFVIYSRLRRSYVADIGTTLLSSLWMQGIMAFACGCTLAGLVATVYLKWLDPTFLPARIDEAIAFYRSAPWPSGRQVADTLELMKRSGAMPSAVQIVVQCIWLGVFTGSMLSLLMGLLVRARPVRPRR